MWPQLVIHLSFQLQTYCHERWTLEKYLNKESNQLKYPFLKKITSKEMQHFCGLTFPFE